MLLNSCLVSLPPDEYRDVIQIHSENNLDFEDCCLTMLTNYLRLILVTLDQDFMKVKKLIKIVSLNG